MKKNGFQAQKLSRNPFFYFAKYNPQDSIEHDLKILIPYRRGAIRQG
ncbi:MAG: hypothetical protein II367_06130 [Treponema sp.]|nr:hypothetical protein [Treponema sp.]